MKCTLITGPAGSGKTALAKNISSRFSANETCVINIIDGDLAVDYFQTVRSMIFPECRLILVEEIATVDSLKKWLRLAWYNNEFYSKFDLFFIRAEMVLIFQSEIPIDHVLTDEHLEGVEVIDLFKQGPPTNQEVEKKSNTLQEYLETQKQSLLLTADEFTREHKDQKSADYCLAQVAFIDQLMDDFVITRTCRQCGCSEMYACVHPIAGPCWWVETDLCSHCQVSPQPLSD